MASTNAYSTSLGLAAIPETKNPEIFAEMIKVYNAFHNLQAALDAYTGPISKDSDIWSSLPPQSTILSGNLNRLYIKFDETVSAGHLINIYNNTEMRARKANANGGIAFSCRGFATKGVTAGDFGEVILQLGLHSLVAGLTPGTIYYLSETVSGSITSSAPSVTGQLVQAVGYALTPTTMMFNPPILGTLVP